MLKPSHKTPIATQEDFEAPPQGDPQDYILSEETVQSLQALGEILRRIDNRLEAEKAAAIGAKRPDDANMRE